MEREVRVSENSSSVKQYWPNSTKNTKEFVRDITRVFKNNLELFDCEKEIIQDVCILLQFEIGRRSVQHNAMEPATETEQTFGKLPINTVITTIVKLLEEERSQQVFHRNEKFRCNREVRVDRDGSIRITQPGNVWKLFLLFLYCFQNTVNAVPGFYYLKRGKI